jgi:E3 ubiquitin-protein ligase TRIP12
MRLKIAPREGTTVPPNLQNLQISIPAVSSFNVLISYIKARMNATGDSSAMEGDVNVTDDERESDEESEIEIHDELDETPVEEKTINLAGSPEKKRSIPTRSSNTPATPVSNLVIYYNDEPVPIGGTVFGTIYQSLPKPVVVSTAVWNTTHSVTFGYDVGSAKKNFHSPKKTGLGCSCHVCSLVYPHIGIDRTDSHTNEFARPLLLLTLMNALNSRYEYIASAFVSQVSESAFLNNKLTAKIAKQLAEPIMTISAIHPDWSWSLMYNSWFLFPFETRLKFLRCTGLGNSRNLVNWLQYHKPSSAESSINLSPLTRTDRLKVKIARKGIFEALVKVIGLIGEKISMLEVEFLNEVGSGLGPTLEFFALVSEAVRKREGVALKSGCPRIPIWRTEESDSSSDMLNPLHGLYPAPMDPRSTNQKYLLLT